LHGHLRHAFDRGGHHCRQPHPGAVAASGTSEGRAQFRRGKIHAGRGLHGAARPHSRHALCRARGDNDMTAIAIQPFNRSLPPTRAEVVCQPEQHVAEIGEVARPLSRFELISNVPWVRRLAIIVMLGVLWQAYAVWIDNPLVLPRLSDTLKALWQTRDVILV